MGNKGFCFDTRLVIRILSCSICVWLTNFSFVYGIKPLSVYATIDSLIIHHDYFSARDFYLAHKGLLCKKDRLLAGARIDNQFNRLDESHRQIAQLLRRYASGLSDSITCKLLELEVVNLSRRGQYDEAAKTSQMLLNRYASILTPAEYDNHLTTHLIWQLLKGVPAQRVDRHSNVILPLVRDKAGLMNLYVKGNDDSCLFVFDTGANMSVVNETMANRFGMKYMDSSVYVNAITGIKVKSRIAVCEKFNMGDVTILHAYFLVFPDSALAFPQIDYQINGIVGFPIIESLGEISIDTAGVAISSRPSKNEDLNMALDFLTPVVRLGGDSYTFDTGAKTTILYHRFYHKYVKTSGKSYVAVKRRFGGAGGTVEKEVYLIDFCGTVGGKPFVLHDVSVLTEHLGTEGHDYFGNIGQDIIGQFGKMTINFKSMFVRFE